MAQSLRKKKILNMVYGLGAAIVLVGALFKILHLSIGPITGAVMLTIGLLTEAFIFAYSAFFEPIEEDLIWTNVYPELTGGTPKERASNSDVDMEGMMTKRLDEMLKESNLDAELIGSLSSSIENFKGIIDAKSKEQIDREVLVAELTAQYSKSKIKKGQLIRIAVICNPDSSD